MLVVDASFLAAVIFEEDHSDYARGVMRDYDQLPLTAPALIAWELASILWKKVRRGSMSSEDVARFAPIYDAFGIRTREPYQGSELVALALSAQTWGLTPYDAAYLDLALGQGLPLATLDKALGKAGRDTGLVVHSPFA